jgi:hypothetical protein
MKLCTSRGVVCASQEGSNVINLCPPPPPPGSIPGYPVGGGGGALQTTLPHTTISIPPHNIHNTAARIPTQLQGYLHTYTQQHTRELQHLCT